MAGAWTNRGKARMWEHFWRATNSPTSFSLVLITGAAAPTVDTDTLAGLTEVANGGGYTTGGLAITRDISATGFETAAEDDAGDRATMDIANRLWTASGAGIPASGGAPRWALLLDNAGNVIAYFDLGSDRVVSAGQTLTLQDPQLRLTEPTPIGVTNRGKKRILQAYLAAVSTPANFFLALATAASTPTADTDTFTAPLVEIATGNGYNTAGGVSVARSAAGFEAVVEDDTGDKATVQLIDVVFTASGGPIPASGSGASWALLLDDNATPGSRDVLCYFNLVSPRTVSAGQTLTIKDAEIQALAA